ncbi:unnamed protein product [Cuscuta campestris]|uniref:Serine aminopeptidase S33 domain-containing protein n=1 Tax=Cuscuta campestris TaxID=132261 RepID=A0A484K821_9ASTE|nr:unnamed protein product [Cuscuta campestris]
MIDQFINFVIRPPRAEYNPDQYLWEKDFTLAGRKYNRHDLELKNKRGHTLQCSHYVPSSFPDDSPLPCVIYCHGNSGCRADANEAAVILLSSNITVFTLDFSGSGLSDGDYVSLGWHEKNDLKVVVTYLRSNPKISRIGLWGRSMGAVTCLLYGAEDPSIAGMVLDSAFSNLFDLMMELVDVYKIRLPKFTVKVAVQYMRRIIQKRAKFDIMKLDCLQVAPQTFIPALFGHAKDDRFIQPHHTDLISKSYAGDKNFIKFDGDHNSSRPQFYYDSVSIFFYNVLRPPRLLTASANKVEMYYELGNMRANTRTDESLLNEIITGLQSVTTETASSSSVPPVISAKFVGDLQSDIAPNSSATDPLVVEENIPHDRQKGTSSQNEDCFSYTSSNRESWGRCSSLGSDNETCSENGHVIMSDNQTQTPLEILATPLRRFRKTILESSRDEKKAKKKNAEMTPPLTKKSRCETFEKLEELSQRLRLCILKRVGRGHNRQRVS